MKNQFPKLVIFFLVLFSPLLIKSQTNYQNVSLKQSGYLNITELNFVFSKGYAPGNSFDIQTVNGYLFNPNFSLGIGAGIGTYNTRTTFIPVFLDARYYFFQKATTTYADIEIGSILNNYYSYNNINNSYKPDLLIAPSVGLRCFISKRMNLNFSIGCRYQTGLYYDAINFNIKMGATFW